MRVESKWCFPTFMYIGVTPGELFKSNSHPLILHHTSLWRMEFSRSGVNTFSWGGSDLDSLGSNHWEIALPATLCACFESVYVENEGQGIWFIDRYGL